MLVSMTILAVSIVVGAIRLALSGDASLLGIVGSTAVALILVGIVVYRVYTFDSTRVATRSVIYCTNCGQTMKSSMRICPRCGQSVE